MRARPPILFLSLLAACGETPEAPADVPEAEAEAVVEEASDDTDELVPVAEGGDPHAEGSKKKKSVWTGLPKKPPEDDPDIPLGGGRPTVIFFVLDTVRAASLSMCGYERPTTPWLDSLVARDGVSHTCHAYSPATWTVPSHASYFTGLKVPEHESDSMGHTFDKGVPVLAEVMKEQGYQPVMVTANPTLSAESGLQRGFDTIRIGKNLKELREEEVPKAVKEMLDKAVDPDEPLFLFVNILDAHDPYPEIPEGLDWVPAQDELEFDVFEENQADDYHRYIRGEMAPAEAEAFLEEVRNGYDYGTFLADRTASQVMAVLRQTGWLENGFRVVLTSDHGEYIGEHSLLRHGCYTFEPVVRVPFVFFDTTRKRELELPEPFSAVHAFELVSTGELPDEVFPAHAVSKKREFDVKIGADMAAVWASNTDKLVWIYDEFLHYDLATDPGEMGHEPLGDHPWRAQIERLATEHAQHLANLRGREKDAKRVEELQALGYME